MAGSGCLLLAGHRGVSSGLFLRVTAALALLAAGMFLATQTVSAGAQVLSPVYSSAAWRQQMAPYVKPDMPFYSLNDYPQSLPFYLGRTLTIVAYKGELEFGIGREPQKWIPDLDAFAAQWRQGGEALAVMPPETYANSRQKGLPMTVIGRDPQPRRSEETMNLVGFLLVFTGVMLNAAAQLLLKAGVRTWASSSSRPAPSSAPAGSSPWSRTSSAA